MNWVGGARQRVKLQGEKKLQKEFFERKKFETKPRKKSRRSPLKPSSVSRDLLALQTVSNIQYSSQGVPKSVRKLDLDQFRSTVCGRRYNEVELPASPNEKPSQIHLYETGCLSSDGTPVSQSLRYKPRPEHASAQCKNSGEIVPKIRLPSSQSSSQHTSSYDKYPFMDPFEKNFNPPSPSPSPSLFSKKSCLKPPKQICDRYLKPYHQENHSFMAHSTKNQQIRKSNCIAFDPWAVEDFQATPLIKYDTSDMKGPYYKRDNYRSMKKAGYFTDQERFHRPSTQQSYHDRKELATNRPFSMETFEISLDLSVNKYKTACQLENNTDDIFDEDIENRFRGSNPLFSKPNGKGYHGKKTTDTPSSSKHKQNFDKTMSGFPPEKKCPASSQFERSSMTSSTPDMCRKVFSNTWKPGDCPTNKKAGCHSQVRSPPLFAPSRKREDETNQRTSPMEGDLFPNSSRTCTEKLKHLTSSRRETCSSIKSVDSTSSSCSDTRACNHKESSDYDCDEHGGLAHADSPLFSQKNTSRSKTSSVDEILEEMKQLESESEDRTTDSDNYYRSSKADNTDISAQTAKSIVTSKQDKRECTDDEVVDEVSQVLQELVHKVVMLTSEHVTDFDDSTFVIPSRPITVTPWKKSLYTSGKNKVSPITFYQKTSKSFNYVWKVNQQPLDVAATHSSSDKKFMKTEGKAGPSDKAPKLLGCDLTPNWNMLNLTSPLLNLPVPKSYGDMIANPTCLDSSNQSKSSSEEGILQPLPEGIFTPKTNTVFSSAECEEKLDTYRTPINRSGELKHNIAPIHTYITLSSIGIPILQPLTFAEKNNTKTQSVPGSTEDITISSSSTHVATMDLEAMTLERNCTSTQATNTDLVSIDHNKNKSFHDKSTQTYGSTVDAATSPIQFMRAREKLCLVNAGTQYEILEASVATLNESEVSMEQGESQELMDCTVPVEVGPADTQWTISDSMLESLSQSDNGAGYSLRSRKKSVFSTCVI